MAPMREKQLSSLPTASGGIARAAYRRALEARLEVGSLLKSSNLASHQVKLSDFRIPVKNQITFLNEVAENLPDPFLGINLAERIDLREIGLLYYAVASSSTLGDALRRLARYSRINNEGILITYRDGKDITIRFEYIGVTRLSDCHQIEFFVVTLLRICRQLAGHNLSPKCVQLAHRRGELPTRIKKLFGCQVAFGSHVDEVIYPEHVKGIPTVNADPYLNSLLVRYCDEALGNRRAQVGPWRVKVENAIVTLLPHGQAQIEEVARTLGVGRRTLARLLASEGCTFRGILHALRATLAKRYLREQNLPISEVAWLLGYQQSSAFTHAFKRWTKKTPRQLRSVFASL